MVVWATYPGRPLPAASEEAPGKDNFPAVGRTMRAAMRKSVVLPEPLRPARTTHSPGAISRETRRRAKRPPKRLSILSKRSPVGGSVREVTAVVQIAPDGVDRDRIPQP